MLSGKQILFPQQCFPGWANRETMIENIMFPQQRFLVCPGFIKSVPVPAETFRQFRLVPVPARTYNIGSGAPLLA